MPPTLALTVSPDAVSLSRSQSAIRAKDVTFTLTNTGPRTVTARAVLEPLGAMPSSWLEVQGEGERDVAPGATHTFTARIGPPADASEGRHTFRLNVVDVHRPDEGEVQGPEVAVDVPPRPEENGDTFPRWLIFAIAAIVALGALAALAVVFWPGGPGEEAVPDLIGMTVDEAREAAAQAEFTLELAEDPVASDEVEAGTVAEQSPAADEMAEVGSQIVATLAAVPDVEGMTRDEAFQALRAAGLEPSVAELTAASGNDVGRVLSQDPVALAGIEAGGTVSLVVGGAQVPNVVGENVNDALRMLQGTGLAFQLNSAFGSGRPDGIVARQSIAEGEVVAAGTTLVLGVAASLDIDLDDLLDPVMQRRFGIQPNFGDPPNPPIPPVTPVFP